VKVLGRQKKGKKQKKKKKNKKTTDQACEMGRRCNIGRWSLTAGASGKGKGPADHAPHKPSLGKTGVCDNCVGTSAGRTQKKILLQSQAEDEFSQNEGQQICCSH